MKHLQLKSLLFVLLLLLLSVAVVICDDAEKNDDTGSSSSSSSSHSSESQSSSSNHSPPPARSLKWAVLVDLSRSSIENMDFKSGIDNYIKKNSAFAAINGPEYFYEPPTILNSEGNILKALNYVSELVKDSTSLPDVIFLGESSDITFAVADLLRLSDATSEILLVTIHSSNNIICNPSTNPRTVCIVPRDNMNVLGMLETSSSQLGWHSVAVVYSNSGYGTGVQSTMMEQVQTASNSPTIVAQLFMNPGNGTDEDDDALIKNILSYKPKAIVAFVREGQLNRLRNALLRAGASDVFLLGSRESLNALPNLTGTYDSTTKPWGAFYVSKYTTAEDLVVQGYFNEGQIDPFEAYIVSHLFDAMYLIAAAGGTSSIANIRKVKFAGFTGNVAFDSVYYQRVEIKFSVITKTYNIDNPLVTWYLKSYSNAAVQTNYNATITSAIVPLSPLRALPICMTGPEHCQDVEKMWALMFVLLKYNADNEQNSDIVSFIPTAINTGTGGVSGLSSLIPVARTCSIITGPGHGNIALALTPVINQFELTTLDYNTANDFFTNEQYSYPYFSRTTTPNSFSYLAFGEICVHYSWERVIIVSTNDQFGLTRASSLQASMTRRNIYVEKVYYMNDTSTESVTDTMNAIYKTDVSRVIFMLVSVGDGDAGRFYELADTLPFMKKYIFILNRDLCSYGYDHPDARRKLVSSICIYPYVPQERLDAINADLAANTALRDKMRLTLSDGGFLSGVDECPLSTIPPQSGFAVDAAYVIIDAVQRAYKANDTLHISATLRSYIRSTSIDKFTCPFSIKSNGDRDFAIFAIDIQTPDSIITVGTWNYTQKPTLNITQTDFLWLDNSKSVPLDTFRDMSFVLGSTLSASPGTIVISILGFVVTIAVFAFCYKHYKTQKIMEHALQSDEFPVTEEELARLRGKLDEI